MKKNLPLLLKQNLFALIIPVALSLFCSCASSDRMLALSPLAASSKIPFREGMDKIDNTKNSNRRLEITGSVNIWPLLYSKNDFVSILWPIIDYDPNGIAVRPLFNKHYDEYSILFPFCAWNPKTGEGWAGNFKWGDNGYGFIPLIFKGKNDWLIMPAWKAKHKYGFGPLWYDTKNNNGGLFPLVYQKKNKEGWFFPIYSFKRTDNEFKINFLLYLLGHYNQDKHRKSINFLNFILSSGKDEMTHTLFPLYFYSNDSKSLLTGALFPLTGYNYSHSDEEDYAHWIFPFYINKHTSKDNLLITPLFITAKDFFWCPLYNKDENWYGFLTSFFWEKDWSEGIILPLLSGWENNDSKIKLNIIWPLYHSEYEKKKSRIKSFRLWPVVSIDASGPVTVIDIDGDDYAVLGSILYSHKERNYTSSYTSKPFECRELKAAGVQSEHKIINRSLLFCESEYRKSTKILPLKRDTHYLPKGEIIDPDPEETISQDSHFYWLFYSKNRKYKKWDFNKVSQKRISKIYLTLNDIHLQDKVKNVNEDEEEIKKEALKRLRKQLREQLKTLGIVLESDDMLDLLKGLVELDKKYSKKFNSGKFYLPLLFHSSYDGDESKWNVLFCLLQSEYNQKHDSGEFNILKYLYRHEYSKENYSLDIFPFINITDTEKYDSTSFMWKLFRLETQKRDKKEKTKLYLFFIPCGEW